MTTKKEKRYLTFLEVKAMLALKNVEQVNILIERGDLIALDLDGVFYIDKVSAERCLQRREQTKKSLTDLTSLSQELLDF